MEGKTRKIRVKKAIAKKYLATLTTTEDTAPVTNANIRKEIKGDDQKIDIGKEEESSSPRLAADDETKKDEIDEYLFDDDKEKERKIFFDYLDSIVAEAEKDNGEEIRNHPSKEKPEATIDNGTVEDVSLEKSGERSIDQTASQESDHTKVKQSKIISSGGERGYRERPKWLATLSLPPIVQAKNMRILRKKIYALEAIEQPDERKKDELKRAKQLLQDITSIPRFSYERWAEHII
mmetsp:Transcript_31784/g.46334  ORF Transcript_31784/g.46334 Transcript_31784/m.46334 type:complete len:236 (-) Transcript_31784:195-902(-)